MRDSGYIPTRPNLEPRITVYYNKVSQQFSRNTRGHIAGGQEEAGPGNLLGSWWARQLYHFVDIASFTKDWADLDLGDDELRELEDTICATQRERPSCPAEVVLERFADLTEPRARGKAVAIEFCTPSYPSTAPYSLSRRGPSLSVRTWNLMTTMLLAGRSHAFKSSIKRGGLR